MGLTRDQAYYAMSIAAKPSGLISLISSSFIVRDVYKKSRKSCNEKLSMTSRIVLNMSLSDIGSSFWMHFIGSWMCPPQYSDLVPFAHGTPATCAAQAFLVDLFMISGAWSNALLAITYWLTVCKEIPESRLRKRSWTALLLGLPWTIGLVIPSIKFVLYPTTTGLWFCEFEIYPSASTPYTPMAYFVYAMFGLVFLLIIFSMGSLIRFVYTAEKRMDRFTAASGSGTDRTKTREVSKQGLSYIGAYMVTFVPALLASLSFLPRWYYVFYSCLFPLQGLFNAFVYFRPKYVAERRRSGASRMGAVVKVLGLGIAVPVRLESSFDVVRKYMRQKTTATEVSSGGNDDAPTTAENP